MKARFADRQRAGLFLFLAVYACLLAGLLPVLSLWLDEILDLIGVRLPRFADLLAYIPLNPGASPLGYIPQFIVVHLLGFSVFWARFPSAVWSVAACAGVFVLARRMGLRWPLLAVAVFALFPLQLRYAMEARLYAFALCWSVWSSVAFLRLVDKPTSPLRIALYGVCVMGGLYTFPFTLFVPAAHLLWAALTRRSKLLLSAGLAMTFAGLAFLPWYLHSSQLWKQGIEGGRLHGTVDARAIPMILRELIGAGYLGTALTLVGVWFGATHVRERLLWILCAIVPVLGAVAAVAGFGYFLAIRQMIFVLVPLALLFAAGVETLFNRNPKAGQALAAALIIACVVGNSNFFRRPRENWQAAASILMTEPCVVYSPPTSHDLYEFFFPALATRQCTRGTSPRVALAVSPYRSDDALAVERRQLQESGYVKRGEFNPATPLIEIYVRP